jgi:hypothetical protein
MPDQPTPASLPTLIAYWNRCARHNFLYLSLDDPHELRRAAAVDGELRAIAARSFAHYRLFYGFYDAAHLRTKRPARPTVAA